MDLFSCTSRSLPFKDFLCGLIRASQVGLLSNGNPPPCRLEKGPGTKGSKFRGKTGKKRLDFDVRRANGSVIETHLVFCRLRGVCISGIKFDKKEYLVFFAP